jgi:hypothetical protein
MTKALDLADVGSAYGGGNGFSLRNALINGGFGIWQRGTTISIAGSTTYTADRWAGIATGANVTASSVAYPEMAGAGSSSMAYVLLGAAGNTGVDIFQRIESSTARGFGGNTVTLSGLLYKTDVSTVTWEAYYANVSDTFSAKTLIATGTVNIPVGGSYTPFAASFDIPVEHGYKGIEIRFKFGALLATKQAAMMDIQLERGAKATVFEDRPIALELAMCQRYYETGLAAWMVQQAAGTVNGSTYLYFAHEVFFKTTKRVLPTIIKTSTPANPYVLTCNAYASSVSSFHINNSGNYGGGTGTSNNAFQTSWFADAEL